MKQKLVTVSSNAHGDYTWEVPSDMNEKDLIGLTESLKVVLIGDENGFVQNCVTFLKKPSKIVFSTMSDVYPYNIRVATSCRL